VVSAEFRRDRVTIIGVLNLTPDSFSDGGRFAAGADGVDLDAAVDAAAGMVRDGVARARRGRRIHAAGCRERPRSARDRAYGPSDRGAAQALRGARLHRYPQGQRRRGGVAGGRHLGERRLGAALRPRAGEGGRGRRCGAAARARPRHAGDDAAGPPLRRRAARGGGRAGGVRRARRGGGRPARAARRGSGHRLRQTPRAQPRAPGPRRVDRRAARAAGVRRALAQVLSRGPDRSAPAARDLASHVASAIAVFAGADAVRTHDVAGAVRAAAVALALRRARTGEGA
jgi:dihydropteroate synthase